MLCFNRLTGEYNTKNTSFCGSIPLREVNVSKTTQSLLVGLKYDQLDS